MAKGKGRTTVYNQITTEEKLCQVNPDNLELGKDFLDYLASTDKAKSTIKQYTSVINIFWCWNLDYNNNKFFVDIKKRELVKFQNHCINVWGWSSNRIKMVKSVLSSLSNFISDILDDEYEDYKPIIGKISSPVNVPVREKSVYTAEDLQPLLDELVESKEYMKACVLSLAINSGRRKAELLRFKTWYFDDENLICDGALYMTPEEVTTKGRGSKGKLLNLYTLAKPFKPYFDMWMDERERLGITSEWLFPKCKDGVWLDEPMNPATLDYWAQIFSDKLSKPFYWHSLRHYCATKLHDAGLPDDIIQKLFGWSSADMCRLYIDSSTSDELIKYFGKDGIKQVKQTSLKEI